MDYNQIVNLVFNIVFLLFALIMLPFVIFGIIGIFKTKKFPLSTVQNKYGLIIPARNEEKVIGNLIKSIQANNYPQEKLTIFVIAHNCNDKTAEVARSLGAIVYEYNNPQEATMGYAFKYLFNQIEKDYQTSSYDGFFLFNADNVVNENYFEKMNDAFEYYHKEAVVTSYRNSKNFGASVLAGLYGIYFVIGCALESRGRTVANVSTRVQGTGYVINSSLVKDGWKYVTLTEDWEFTADQILKNSKIRYCNEAVFYDEQPTKFSVMWRQRVRWSRGHLLVFIQKYTSMVGSIFHKKQSNKISRYDISVNMLPVCLIITFLEFLRVIALLLEPIFYDVTEYELFIGNANLLFPDGLLFLFLRNAIVSFIGGILMAAFVFILERKKIKQVSLLKKVAICICWPLFIVIQFFIDIQALFSKNLEWKVIPHDDTTSIHAIHAKAKKSK